ncbi:DNA polymerase III subunit gamma/tau [Paenibacillus typhae]|uniref:Uncharacterized protein n=1 Tax=Paenibacillus typhae TaxID=1174501 RepID=A0A1G8YYZ6_9BACL|nr:DNA polymerase III subunit gamma/tau [Paenibacillus typhae]SDK08109.1 hypothetical protein SAMN05216192_13119 [Paenibacillus typhae]
MFNKDLRETAIRNMKAEQSRYESENKQLVGDAEQLLGKRRLLKSAVDESWEFINSMRNKPTALDTELKIIKIESKKFSGLLDTLEKEISKANFTSGGTAATGVAAGIGVAAFGPTAALAIATTFGTASTGTAIATLSGAAATNAALAWLGGGALVAGGGGTAAGTALLGLAGPVGWAIGGGALVTAGLLKSGKNKKIAEQASTEAAKIRKHVKAVEAARKEIQEITSLSTAASDGLRSMLLQCRTLTTDYTQLTPEAKQRLGALVNNTKAGAQLLNRAVGANA